MTSIYQIPYEDIELFLLTNDIDVSSDKDLNYNIAVSIIDDPNANFEINSISNWMIAHNLIELDIEIPMYKKSDVLKMNYIKLKELSLSLLMKDAELDNILNVLNYINKLDDDMSEKVIVQIVNNKDILVETLRFLFIDDIINFCTLSKSINKKCNNNYVINLIRSKLQKMDALDISAYTLKELLLFLKLP
jgi:hypothetical protein